MTSLKERKEAFVSGHEGTSPWEILLIIFTTPIGLLFYQVMASRYNSGENNSQWRLIIWEAISFGIPIIICQSNLLYPWGVGYLSVQLLVGLASIQAKESSDSEATTIFTDNQRSTLTIYRASLLFLTFIAILAVDFHVFPRRFVKTETNGYSLMDVGAASFVFAAGLVSAKSRGRLVDVRKTMMRIIPLLVMGFVRLLTHKSLEYQEHATEYGLHWNFFFTLAMLSPTACFLPGPSWVLPVALMVVYQAALSSGLQDWVVDAPRHCFNDGFICNFVFANREGILGCIGYGALYSMSEWIGYAYFWRRAELKNYRWLLAVLGGSWILLTTLGNIPVSRRTTNASFVVWILLINMLQLLAIKWVVERGCRVPMVFDAVNANGLAMFVIANLLTGLTNLSMNTLNVSDGWALAVLAVYLCAIGGIGCGLKHLLQRRKDAMPEGKEKDG